MVSYHSLPSRTLPSFSDVLEVQPSEGISSLRFSSSRGVYACVVSVPVWCACLCGVHAGVVSVWCLCLCGVHVCMACMPVCCTYLEYVVTVHVCCHWLCGMVPCER